MSKKVEKALELLTAGLTVPRLLSVHFEDFDADEKTLMKLARGFGGGMRCGEVCGAVSGFSYGT